MNYNRRKSNGIFPKILGSLFKAGVVFALVFLICNNTDFAAEAEPATVEIPYDVSAAILAEKQSADYAEEASQGFVNPTVGVLTSAFGKRWGRNHNGIDIGADMNTEIYAAASGIVTYAGEMDGYGNYVVIDHENGFETAYAHCNTILVSVNKSVKKGEIIAYVGSTGNSTGPHLHFEVRLSGEHLNPLDYVVY